jgi:endo-1,4-beta-D-glucanase Y
MILAHSPRRQLIRHARTALLLPLLPLLLSMSASALAQQGAAKLKETQVVCPAWPRWETFKTRFISPEGRVIDLGSPDTRTTSEGQSYGLFFALVANDKPAFEKLLAWTQNNLAEGDLIGHLPAWLWGESTDGVFKVLDTNSASDADLWIAYSLVQAGRQWRERRFTAIGALLAKRILQEETAALPGLGRSLLPGPVGYQLDERRWRLNPSYLPLQVLQGLATALPDQPQWRQMRAPALRLLMEPATQGFAPDWVLYRAAENVPGPSGDTPGIKDRQQSGGFSSDTATAASGSYNAIRAYLWAGMLAPGDSARAPLLKTYQPMADYVRVHGFPPETVDTVSGEFGPNAGFKGFSAAVLPMLSTSNQSAPADGQRARIEDLDKQASGSGYYSEVLTLFGTGWSEGRFRFAADGSLLAAWNDTCSSVR